MIDSEAPTSICILRLSAIGDVCHAVSAVQAIQRRLPHASVTWIIGKVEHELVRGLDGVEFVVFDKSARVSAYRDLRSNLGGRQFDVLLHMQVALRANLAAMLVSAKVKVGFDRRRAKEGHRFVISHAIAAQHEPHVLEGFAEFARTLGVTETGPRWHMPYSEADDRWALTMLALHAGRGENDQNNVESSTHSPLKVFTIAPTASKAERNWTVEGYAQLADHAAAKGYMTVLTGAATPADRRLAGAIVARAQSDVLDLVGKTSLKQLLCVLKHSDLMLAPDTGPAHMAVTVNTPVIGLYAHSNPSRTGPYRCREYVVEVYHKNALSGQSDAAVRRPWGHRLKGAQLMRQITVERVRDMFDRVTGHSE